MDEYEREHSPGPLLIVILGALLKVPLGYVLAKLLKMFLNP